MDISRLRDHIAAVAHATLKSYEIYPSADTCTDGVDFALSSAECLAALENFAFGEIGRLFLLRAVSKDAENGQCNRLRDKSLVDQVQLIFIQT